MTKLCKIAPFKKSKRTKENFMDILLIGDEEETMVCKYLDIGNLYALYDSGVLKSVCALIFADKTTVEIKKPCNLAEVSKPGLRKLFA